MTTIIYDLIQDRTEAILQALHNEDLDALYTLAESSTDEDEYLDIQQYIKGIEVIRDNEWAHDRSIDN